MKKPLGFLDSVLTTVLLVVLAAVLGTGDARAARGWAHLNPTGTTLVADNGNLLRGPQTATSSGTTPSLATLLAITNYGCNAIHCYAEGANAGYAAGTQSNAVDTIVRWTRTNGLYLIITIGDGGVNMNFDTNFWKFYAGRYANETHVLFEIQNEVSSGGPSSASVIALETNCYNIIRAAAPNTPVLFFSYVAFSNGSGVVQDINALGPGIDWTKAAVGFHGYGSGGPAGMQTCLQYVLNAGYPCFQTEFYRWPWGTGNFNLGDGTSMYQDVAETGIFERIGVSWLSFLSVSFIPNNARFKDLINNGGVVWTPDYGVWPSGSRGTYGNGGTPWFTTNLSSTLRIQAENYDTGGQGVAYNDTTSNNSGGSYRSDDVDIESTFDAGGGYEVTSIASGEWLEYTTWIYEAGFYNLKLRVASSQPTNRLSVSFFGTNLTGTVTFPGTGGDQIWATITNTVFLKPGQQLLHIDMLSSGFNLNWIELSSAPSGFLTNGGYKIINRNSGLALEVAGAATTNGASIDQSTYTGAANQRWTFAHQGGDQYLITSAQTGKAIDESSYTSWSGDYIQAWTSANSLNQRWFFLPVEQGYFKILSVNSGLALETAGGAGTSGAIIDQSEYTGASSQQWFVIATNLPIPPSVPSGLNASPTSFSTMALNWLLSPGATGYNVKRATVSGGPYTTIAANVIATNYLDTGLFSLTTYYYVVSAMNSNSNTESADSLEAGATTLTNGTIIMDNADPFGVTITGTWTSSTSVVGYYDSDYLQDGNTGATGGKSVRFSPDITTAGSYQIYLNWPAGANRASNTPVDINSAAGTNHLNINQQAGGAWQLLGTFNFFAGTNGSVLIRNDGANGYVIADAVKFVLTSASNLAPATLIAVMDTNNFTLRWPADHIGWHLQVQSNSLSVGLTANWIDIAGTSNVNSFTNPLIRTEGAVFYRLKYP
jgi:endoglucanase